MQSLDTYLKYAGGAAEILAALTGFICLPKFKNSYWKWFPLYLLVIAVAENVNLYHKPWNNFLNSTVFPYIIVPLEFLFFTWLFSRQFRPAGRWWCLAAVFVYLAAFVADQCYFSQQHNWFYSFSYSVGNIILLALIIAYLTGFARGGEVIHFKVNMMFWVCLGLIFFYLGSFPFFGFLNTLYRDYPELFIPYFRITLVLNILMYLLFTTGFIWTRKK